jgi:hypothetical protein
MGRQKPSKPRRERPEPVTHDHSTGFDHDTNDFGGLPVNGGLLADLIGAALDGCTTCQDPLLTLLAEDPVTTARMVSVACIAVAEVTGGGLPSSLLNPDTPGFASQEFRKIANAGVNQDTEDLTAAKMLGVIVPMTPTERRAAANSALDLIAGSL